jgi:hypothetical protein
MTATWKPDIEGQCFAAKIADGNAVMFYMLGDEEEWVPLTPLGVPKSWLTDFNQVICRAAMKLETMPEAIGAG